MKLCKMLRQQQKKEQCARGLIFCTYLSKWRKNHWKWEMSVMFMRDEIQNRTEGRNNTKRKKTRIGN